MPHNLSSDLAQSLEGEPMAAVRASHIQFGVDAGNQVISFFGPQPCCCYL